MRACGVFGLLLPAFLACSGKHVVAGEEKTRAEKLAADLPGWCSDICRAIYECDGEECVCDGDSCDCAGDVNDCPEDCLDDMRRWAQGSDQCAAAGQRFIDCVEANACDVVSNHACEPSQAEADACPDPDHLVGGDSGGSTNPPNIEGDLPAEPLVTCLGGDSTGPAPPEPGVTQLLCELGHFDCSDESDRGVLCITTAQGPTSCTCRLNGVVTGAFDPGGVCPSIAQQNVGCGWNLEER
jgi:hypothetical protein